jgi:cytochrome b pre-mRNA-processing protein 3
LTFLQRIFGGARQRAALAPLYRAIVAEAREPHWYREGRVPDTMDGRFDMVAALMALVLIRLEDEGEEGRETSRLLTELFIEDMAATLREIGIGDQVVGKHVGRMMSALGGRLTAFRKAGEERGFTAAVRRNIFHDAPPSDKAVALVAARMEALTQQIGAVTNADLRNGILVK